MQFCHEISLDNGMLLSFQVYDHSFAGPGSFHKRENKQPPVMCAVQEVVF